ncbi:MAG TPA: Crp/Fnr family transcriptional regulator [Bacteroidetes bacterium]|nr:Crp/Fnr family transcriptional regulator [Bacteroidota bacterium]
MEKTLLKKELKDLFPIFSQSELIEEISERGQILEIPAGHRVFDFGNIITVIPLVFSGSIKVVREDEEGNEIFLYYIRKGESCAMTLSSCLKREKSSIKAIVQSDTLALALPVEAVYGFAHKYPSWSDFLVDTYSRRFEEILAVVDNIAFNKMDVRLLKYLMEKGKIMGTDKLTVSKTAIAKDLNSSREVISRLLKQMEKNKLVRLGRNTVELL